MKIVLASILTLLSTNAFAHPGHDHNAWASNWIHLSLGVAIAFTALFAVVAFIQRKSKATQTEETKP